LVHGAALDPYEMLTVMFGYARSKFGINTLHPASPAALETMLIVT
jgi:hypothetical protein